MGETSQRFLERQVFAELTHIVFSECLPLGRCMVTLGTGPRPISMDDRLKLLPSHSHAVTGGLYIPIDEYDVAELIVG